MIRMSNNVMRFSSLLVVLFIAACASNSYRTLDPKYVELREQAEQAPDDILLLSRVADQARQNYSTTGINEYSEDAIRYLERLLQLNPGHVGASVVLYSVLGDRMLRTTSLRDMPRLRSLFQQTSILQHTDKVAPPSFVEAIVRLRSGHGDSSLAEVRSSLREALKENPQYLRTQIMLGGIYMDMGKPRVAEAMFLATLKKGPSDPGDSKLLAFFLNDLSEGTMCDLDRDKHRSQLRNAIEATKAALKTNPHNPDLAYNLSILYEGLDRRKLAIFEAQQYAGLKKDRKAGWFLVDQYRAAEEFDKADKLSRELLAQHPADAEELEDEAMTAFQRGDFEMAADKFQEYRSVQPRPSVYSAVREAIVSQRLGRDGQSRQALAAIDIASVNDRWERALLRFHRRELSENTLLSAARDACEKTEAHYFVAWRAWLEGDKQAARQHFERVLGYEVPRFFEYTAAKAHLRSL